MKRSKQVVEKEKSTVAYILLGLLVAGAFLLRTIPQWGNIFVGGNVWFRGVDSWYHMRLVDNMVCNFPILLKWDMFALYPNGIGVGYYPLLTWIISSGGLIFNHEIVGALIPPILGAVLLIPIYFLGKELFNKTTGLVACLLVAVLPGELLHRSLLGFTDHHILESLLMVTTILFIVLAYKHKRYLYWGLAGLSLGLYMLTWLGGLFLVFIIGTWFLFQFYYDYFKGKPLANLARGTSLTLTIALLLSFYFLAEVTIIGTVAVAIAPLILERLACLSKKALIGTPVAIGILLIALACFNVFGLGTIISRNFRLVFWGWGATIQEAMPTGFKLAYSAYGISAFLMLGGLYYCIKNKVNLLFIVWLVILVLAVVGQRRWGYYTTIPVALAASYCLVSVTTNWLRKDVRAAAVMIGCLLLTLPCVGGIIKVVTLPNNITLDWHNSLVWMRENTPEPYYQNGYCKQSREQEMEYGILSWWDYGHWIIRIAHRAPVTSPTFQDTPIGSKFFASKTLEEANKALEGYNIKYIILDETVITSKWYAVIGKAKRDTDVTESIAFKLWEDKLEGWQLVHAEGIVRVFERERSSTKS